jgi:hypothetical protein
MTFSKTSKSANVIGGHTHFARGSPAVAELLTAIRRLPDFFRRQANMASPCARIPEILAKVANLTKTASTSPGPVERRPAYKTEVRSFKSILPGFLRRPPGSQKLASWQTRLVRPTSHATYELATGGTLVGIGKRNSVSFAFSAVTNTLGVSHSAADNDWA